MSLPLLAYPLSSQNSRVAPPGGASLASQQFLQDAGGSYSQASGVDQLIEKAYKQVFFHAMRCDRIEHLESQLRNGMIPVREFIRGLLLSRRFKEGYYQCNSNYRMVDQIVGRVLGRPVYNDAERRTWSIVIAQEGLEGFVNQLLDSEEYINAFGLDQVPEQRSRSLAGRATGEMPIYQQFPRYGSDWRDTMRKRTPSASVNSYEPLPAAKWLPTKPPALALKVWLVLFAIGGFEILRVLVLVGLSMLRTN
ncbi:MAG: phycobilisome Linker polypeptide [Synechococcaceae bacterium WB6_1B_055]|nr:phycobilisome Linker polypeptide [Synechococcaceae bacterium WB6_1B_055]NCU76833.1 phycobilisome Linker polypeptide [Synechococcaceae bacterium WB7_1C_051]